MQAYAVAQYSSDQTAYGQAEHAVMTTIFAIVSEAQ